MGCDIHATIEFNEDGEKPACFLCFAQNVFIARNYRLFHYLGNIQRGAPDDPILSPPRGIPTDATLEYRLYLEEEGNDGHTYSFLYAHELRGIPEDDKQDDWYQVICLLAHRYGDDNVRLCYFFDN